MRAPCQSNIFLLQPARLPVHERGLLDVTTGSGQENQRVKSSPSRFEYVLEVGSLPRTGGSIYYRAVVDLHTSVIVVFQGYLLVEATHRYTHVHKAHKYVRRNET